MSFSVLFVCTGNICRSPVAERLFRARMAPSADVVVSSAGTSGLPGWEMDASCALALREFGGDPDGHVSRSVDDEMVSSSDLVLTASREHRGTLLRAQPSAMGKTFTMCEFTRLAQHAPSPPSDGRLDVDQWRARVRTIAEQRGVADAPAPGADDIGDPYGASMHIVRNTVARISTVVDEALRALRLDAGEHSPLCASPPIAPPK